MVVEECISMTVVVNPFLTSSSQKGPPYEMKRKPLMTPIENDKLYLHYLTSSNDIYRNCDGVTMV